MFAILIGYGVAMAIGYMIAMIVLGAMIVAIIYYFVFVFLSSILLKFGINFLDDVKNHRLQSIIAIIKNSGFSSWSGIYMVSTIFGMIVAYFIYKPFDNIWIYSLWTALITYLITGIGLYIKFGQAYDRRTSYMDMGSKSTGNRTYDHVLFNVNNIQLRDIAISVLSANSMKNVQKLYGPDDVHLLLEIEDGRVAVRCKAEKTDVGIEVLNRLCEGMQNHKCGAGIIFTNQYFTAEARQASERLQIALYDRDFIYKAMIKKGWHK